MSDFLNGVGIMSALLNACGYKGFSIKVTESCLNEMLEETQCSTKEELENVLGLKIYIDGHTD